MFTQEEKTAIEARGISLATVEKQIEGFVNGFPPLNISRAARVGDGIIALEEEQIDAYEQHFQNFVEQTKIVKFVPASGAATRMFKELFEFVNDGKRGKGIDTLLENIEKFAFYDELKAIVGEGATDEQIVSAIVKEGLDYGAKPKALVSFHDYPEGARKAVEEHLVEAALYATSQSVARVHFTVSPEHLAGFETIIAEKKAMYEDLYEVKFDISFSTQKPSTDTIAVNPDNTPFRTDDGQLLFRPAGHGALIENVADIDADMIFIKTIDNVTTDALRNDTVRYKQALGGMLFEKQQRAFELIRSIDAGSANLAEVAAFIEEELQQRLSADYTAESLRAVLNRPLRICGMVRNEGEPGGGPFWAMNEDGSESLQIAESSQIAADKMSLMQEATHFNPVDLVCAPKDLNGESFTLSDFVDSSTGFISEKSFGGRDLRAQELPGLWNGAMARWNTIFVEVPISTFSPVKVVQDLLRTQHQS